MFRCRACSRHDERWRGRCMCKEWGTLEIDAAGIDARSLATSPLRATPITEIEVPELPRISTGFAAFDRVLGSGAVLGGVTLLTSDPGLGKSTLLLQALCRIAEEGHETVYFSGEESLVQIGDRARRTKCIHPSLSVLSAHEVEHVEAVLQTQKPKAFVLDSLQTFFCEEIDAPPGRVTQVVAVTNRLIAIAKFEGMACFLVCHITKGGDAAGPKAVEHLVDTALYFEGNKGSDIRVLGARTKNRFGNTLERAVFRMTECGLVEAPTAGDSLSDLKTRETLPDPREVERRTDRTMLPPELAHVQDDSAEAASTKPRTPEGGDEGL